MIYIKNISKIRHLTTIKKIKKGYKKTFERYQVLSKEEKGKKQQYGHEWYKNLLKGESINWLYIAKDT